MGNAGNSAITVEVTINAPVEKVWELFTAAGHISQWYHASDDWHVPHAENDLREGGKFKITMAAKDGSFGFDFEGSYTAIEETNLVEYVLADGRKVIITFEGAGASTRVVETFDPENTNPPEVQKGGWQAILENFKKYAETNA